MPRHPSRPWALAAAAWALSFAVLHVAWSLGARLALHDVTAADAAFDRTWFQLYNVAVVVGSVLAAAAASLLLRPGTARSHLWRTIVWTAGALLLARGAIGAGELALRTATGSATAPLQAWSVDGYMLLGGSLFLVAAWRDQRQRRCERTPRGGAPES